MTSCTKTPSPLHHPSPPPWHPGQVWRTESRDDGQTWSHPVATGLPNGCATWGAVSVGTKLVVGCASFAAISEDKGVRVRVYVCACVCMYVRACACVCMCVRVRYESFEYIHLDVCKHTFQCIHHFTSPINNIFCITTPKQPTRPHGGAAPATSPRAPTSPAWGNPSSPSTVAAPPAWP